MQLVGCDASYIAAGFSYFTVESHLQHIAEVHAGARIRVLTQLLPGSGKRLHLYSQLFDEGGQLLATGEQLLIHVSLATRRAAPLAASLQQMLQQIETTQAALPRPGRLHCGQRD